MNTDERDREIAATWRAASRDEPPAALDDAIRAAARRAVGAGPSRARHMRTWPLAAAAVMAVFAVGLLQLTPPEQVTPGMDADLTLLQQKAQNETKLAGAAAPVIAGVGKPDAPVEVASNNAAAAGSANRDAVDVSPASPSRSSPAPTASVAASAAALEKRNADAADAPKRGAGVADAPGRERIASLARKELAQTPAATPPLTAQRSGAAHMREQARDDVANTTAERSESDKKNKQEAGVGVTPGVTAPEVQAQAKARADPFPATAAQDKVAAGAPPAEPAPPAMSVPAPAASPVPAPAPPTPAAAPRAMTALNRPAPPPAEAAGALSARRDSAPAAMPEKLAKDSAPRPADEWIRLIRKLQSEGRNDDAVKELAAFRAAYKERADALLPADLRAIKP